MLLRAAPEQAPRYGSTAIVVSTSPFPAAYLSDLAAGTDRFFGERRESCPWCDSKQLKLLLRTADVMQHKPGVFALDSCDDCGHVFQNPRLNDDGLEFYYRDFYDGLGKENMTKIFGTKRGGHDGRTHMVAAQGKPMQWLDVGTGHGHFLADAKRVLPDTEFDGLDLTDGVLIAQQKGRVRKAYQGHFTELVPEFDGRYDVISMYHYLEHTADPEAETTAAAAALPVGRYLAIERDQRVSRSAGHGLDLDTVITFPLRRRTWFRSTRPM